MAIRVERGIRQALPDGTALTLDLWLPEQIRCAPLIVRTPYSRGLHPIARPLDALRMMDEGIPLVIQDVRGRGSSEGDFSPFLREPSDTIDTLAWVSQQPWAIGPPAMAGPSYSGFLQYQALSARTPTLSAICPQFAPLDLYLDWAYRQGVFELGTAKWWHLQAIALTQSTRVPGSPDAPRIRQMVDDLVHTGYRNMSHLGAPADALAPTYRQWVDHLDRDAYWNKHTRSPMRGWRPSKPVPALITAGWFDVFLRGSIRAYHALREANHRPRLIIGPWAHVSTLGSYPNQSFGAQASADAIDLSGLHAQFLLAASSAEELSGPEVRAFLMGRNTWLELDEWPPGPAQSVDVNLSDCRGTPTTPAMATLRLDPDHLVPSVGGATLMPGAYANHEVGPVDCERILTHPNCLILRLPRQATARAFVGPISLTLCVKSSSDLADIHASLVQVRSGGRSSLIVDGAVLVGKQNYVVIDLADTAVVPDSAAMVLLVLSASSFPRYAPSPQLRSADGKTEAVPTEIDLANSWLTITQITDDKRF
ncbi:CocE/NonD family hydrolase [Gemmatimonas sp.]|uniref:CocE/NonD family hydrolase n=1 Tax=Gemmatimonas sp. TaxID=1962908 RepID=UPI003563D9E6